MTTRHHNHKKRKVQHEYQSIITNTTTELTHPTEAGWEEVLENIIKENNIQLTNTVDAKNKELKDSILSNVNNILKKFQVSLILSVSTMIFTQIEAINQNMITTINETINNHPGNQ